jgi:hypothetical protein
VGSTNLITSLFSSENDSLFVLLVVVVGYWLLVVVGRWLLLVVCWSLVVVGGCWWLLLFVVGVYKIPNWKKMSSWYNKFSSWMV